MSSSRDFLREERDYVRTKLIEAIDQGRCRLASGGGVAVMVVRRVDGALSFFAVLRAGRRVADHASGTLPGGILSAEAMAAGLRDDLASGRRPWTNDQPIFRDLVGPDGGVPPSPSERRAAVRFAGEFAAAQDVMAEQSAGECACHRDSDQERAERVALYDVMRRAEGVAGEIVHNWPWAVPDVFDRETRTFDVGASGKAAAVAGLAMLRSHDETRSRIGPGLAKAMEGLRGLITDADNEWMLPTALRTFDDLPPEWIPGRGIDDAPREWAVAIDVAHTVGEIAEAIGRRPRSLIKTFPGTWIGLAADLADATGIGFDSREPTFNTVECWKDMVQAFERQVFRPAMRCAGMVPAENDYGGFTLVGGDNPNERAASLRLLIGEKGLTGFGELAERWHGRVTDLANAEISRAAGHGGAWQVPFARRQLWTPDGVPIEVRCLSSAQEFLDEGADAPDAEGVHGLGHCIASYAADVRRSGNVVVSIRGLDEAGRTRRLSTAYFVWDDDRDRFVLDQHHGRHNSMPPAPAMDAVEAVARLLPTRRPDVRGGEGVFFDPLDRRAVAGMIAAWRFALPKAARSWTPEELVAASGVKTG